MQVSKILIFLGLIGALFLTSGCSIHVSGSVGKNFYFRINN
ncbi:putative lipoprotein [Persephonella marina EX-H1]|uniref:Putative lipoprotein n=1 Tax=Persephonella marina (strain DSM 14350 / EX-H1) TaxID=123214 RepID=C0QQ92_PERMH|nr:putative lipoprotein [Persephonella marina EX-H1]